MDQIKPLVAALIHTTSIVKSIHPETIFQYNLADKDITFANIHMISNSQTNKDIHISNNLITSHKG